jgi:hypothetical protein
LRLFIICLISFFSITTKATTSLQFEKIVFNRDDEEISGLLLQDGQLLFVADKLSNRAIYKIIFENERFYYQNHIDLSKLTNHDSYFAKALLFRHAGRIVKSPFDLEGISYCDNYYYLVNEQTRHVLKINQKSLEQLPIDFFPIFKTFGYDLNAIETNAGFEGIAIDCPNKIMYIAQEREPRAIIVVDMQTNTPVDIYQVGKTTIGINPDYADLYFENGFLYILERNAYKILKVDPKLKTVVAEASFAKLGDVIPMSEIYETEKPFGMAEGLAMDKDRIYIAIDNNQSDITVKAQRAFGIKGKFSSLVIFTRPTNF